MSIKLRKKCKKRTNEVGIFFVAPALIFYSLFVTIPIITTIWYSLNEWNGADSLKKFVGLENYARLIHDRVFWKALSNNLIWIVASIALPLVIGLILALIISTKEVKGKLIFRVTYFMPTVLSMTIVAYIWDWMYNPNFGVINSIIIKFGGEGGIAWLGDERLVLPALIIASSWTSYGFTMVVFLAAIQNISQDYFEVAEVEGATKLQIVKHITIPMLHNAIVLMVINTLIGSMKVFEIIYLLTKGGPYNSSEVISTYMYTNTFDLFNVGYGAAISCTLAVIICIITIVSLKASERED